MPPFESQANIMHFFTVCIYSVIFVNFNFNILSSRSLILVYTEFILVWLWRKLLAYRNTLKSFPGTNQYLAVSVKFLAQGNNGLSLTGFEPMRLVILRLLVWPVNHTTTLPSCNNREAFSSKWIYFGTLQVDGHLKITVFYNLT